MQHPDDVDGRTGERLPGEARRIVGRYLADADRLLPGRVEGLYVVGSTALGGYRPGRSDLDFFAVVDGDLSSGELRRLRLLHLAGGARAAARALPRGRLLLPARPTASTCGRRTWPGRSPSSCRWRRTPGRRSPSVGAST